MHRISAACAAGAAIIALAAMAGFASAARAATTVQTNGSVSWTDSVQSEYYGDTQIVNFPTQTFNTDTGNNTFTSGAATVVAGDRVYRGGQYTPSTAQYGQQGRFLQLYNPGDGASYDKVQFTFTSPQSFFGALIANQGAGDLATFYSGGNAIGAINLGDLATYGPGYRASNILVSTYYLNANMTNGATYDKVVFTGNNEYVSDIRYTNNAIYLTSLTGSGTALADTSTPIPEPAGIAFGTLLATGIATVARRRRNAPTA